MAKKYLSFGAVGFIIAALMFVLSLNVMTAHSGEMPYMTDKSDRTILKEVLVNQRETHALLREIKMLLQEKK